MAVIEQLIRNSDNQIKLTLTEDGLPISGAWTELDIYINDVNLHRTADGDGVTLSVSTGVLTITPADLAAGEITLLAALSIRELHPVQIVVTSTLNDDGAVFGGEGSPLILFRISDKP